MNIDDMQDIIHPEVLLHERISQRTASMAITLQSQFRGNRVISHFYPEHWAKVLLARDNARRYAE